MRTAEPVRLRMAHHMLRIRIVLGRIRARGRSEPRDTTTNKRIGLKRLWSRTLILTRTWSQSGEAPSETPQPRSNLRHSPRQRVGKAHGSERSALAEKEQGLLWPPSEALSRALLELRSARPCANEHAFFHLHCQPPASPPSTNWEQLRNDRSEKHPDERSNDRTMN